MATRNIRKVYNYRFPQLYKNVGIYCRVSSKIQEQLDSIANQASFFVQMVKERSDWILSDIYLDFRSGESISNRYEFQRMMSDAKDGKLDLILTKSISRFGRNVTDTLTALRELKAANVFVMFDSENIDTATEDSELTLTILSAYAEAENINRRELQNISIEQKLKNDTSTLFSRPCYGYKNNSDGNLIIDTTQAEVVQNIFEMYLNGKSILGIISELEKQEIKSPTGKDKWCKRTIDTMLSNEKYIGDIMIFKTFTTTSYEHKRVINKNGEHTKYAVYNNHPAIITKEIFESVQKEKERRSNITIDENGAHRKSQKYRSKKVSLICIRKHQ